VSKTTTTPTAIESAASALRAAETRLALLEAEQRALPQRLEAALAALDLDEAPRLQQRADALPRELLVARVQAARARMAWLEAQRRDPAHADAKAADFRALEVAMAGLAEAQAAVTAAQTAVANRQADERDLMMRIGNCKRELAELTAQLTHAGEGPVMRARFLAPRAQ
jgi:hypothetical protein